ncbi:MAG: ABC transporter permease [Pseudobutyrivibrio sp.]|nr:ABC transporter permease [Pseudobutyrivibrio sp.]
MQAVLKHELALFYHSLTGYVFGAFLLVFTGLGALIYNINASVANFEYVLAFIQIVFIIIVPILTMRIIADEKRQRTDQLLYSLPISTTDIVIGKFLALMVVFIIPMVFISLYPLIFAMYGQVYLPTSYGSIVAFIFLGLALISIGMFISSLTESQGMAAGICVVAMLFNYYCETLADYVSATAISSLISIIVLMIIIGLIIRFMTKSDILGYGFMAITAIIAIVVYMVKSTALESLLPNVMKELSLFSRFTPFVNGIFDLTAIVYYLSVIAFFLFLTVQSLEKRRYNG